jgi:hypothetical protein
MSSGFINVLSQDVVETSTVKEHDLNTLAQTSDGRLFRYSRAGGTALSRGKLTVAATQEANHANIAVAATAPVGATEVSVTLGATAATADQYEDGYLVVNDAAGEGTLYPIRANEAGDGAATITVYLAEPIRVQLTTSSEVSLVLNTQAGVVISATDQADAPTGVPVIDVAGGLYFWCQTGGVCSVLADEAITAGLSLTIGTGVAGAVEALDAAGEPLVGTALQAGVDTEYRAVVLSID